MPTIITRGAASAKGFGFTNVSSQKLTGITYSVSSTFTGNNPPTYFYMNDDNANGSTNNSQWGSNSGTNNFISADLGGQKTITSVVVGYDYLNNLPGGWGVSYTQGLSIQTSPNNTTWTTQATTPVYSSTGSTNGLVRVSFTPVTANYVRLFLASSGYICTLEFQVWGY